MRAEHIPRAPQPLPFRVVLLFGLPTTEAEFFDAASWPHRSDYMAQVLGASAHEQGAATAVWRRAFASIAQAAQDLAEAVHTMGGKVYQRAGLDQLAAAATEADVILLAAHWKGETALRRDFRLGVFALADAIMQSPSPVAKLLRGWRGGKAMHKLAVAKDEHAGAARMEALLNEVIISGKLLKLTERLDRRDRMDLGKAVSRDMIDAAFPDHIESGNRLELADALHPPAEIAAAMAPFDGEIDLSACQSVVLARFLRVAFGERALIVHNARLLQPAPRYRTLREALKRAADFQQPYHIARGALERDIVALRALAKRK